MPIPAEIRTVIEKNMNLMVDQTKSYSSFIKIAFPYVRNIDDLTFNLMVGNTLSVFLSQYSMRLQSPSENDFAEFVQLLEPYRQKIKEALK